MNNTLLRQDDTLSMKSFVSSAAATANSSTHETGNEKQLIGQLVRRILVVGRVKPIEWPAKESLLMSMSESILSSSLRPLMLTSNSNAPAILDACQKRLKSLDSTLQSAVRFSALATAFLASNDSVYGNVRVTGGDEFARKAALIYFLLRVGEKSGNKPNPSNEKTIFEMVKKPEIEEASRSESLNQINSRIQSVLLASEQPRVQSTNPTEPRHDNYSYNQPAQTPHSSQNHQAHSSVWEQFEAMKRQDCGGVAEEAFSRDLIYVLQGLEGNLLLFNESEGRYVVNGRIRVARPIKSLVEKLGKIGTDYRYLQGQVGAVHRQSSGGVLRQSFCRAMAQELAEYLKLVAYLESSLNQTKGSEESSVSLKKVVYWFHEAGILLNFLKELVSDTLNLRGGAFLSFLEQFRQHGNDQIRAVITRILDQMMIPYGEMLQGWLREGILNDQFDEFFISESRGSRSFDFDGFEFWNQKFILKLDEIPKFIPEALARRALIAGKTRKFIQAFLKNPPTHLRYQSSTSLTAPLNDCEANFDVLRENLLESMEKEMKLAYRNACKQVRRILIEDCQLIEQIRCIKHYVLLCKGDFSMNLLELLWDGLNRPAGSLFRHNLVGVLESSIASTRNPKESDWLLANLDVRLLSNDQISGSGACGWDVFALDYRVSFPVDCVLDPQTMQEYSKLSRHVWSLKRLEAVLSRCFQNLRNAQVSVSKNVKKELRQDFRRMELLQYEMISFVRQALSVSFEAICGEWDTFEVTLSRSLVESEDESSDGVDLDALIAAHRNYLTNLKTKLGLWSSQAMRSKMSVISLGILRFETVQNGLISILQNDPTAPSLHEMRNSFQSSARHFQVDLDDLFMTLQKESVLSNVSNAVDLVSRLDFNEYHRRRNGFDTRKYC